MDILTIQICPFYQHGIFFHLLVSSSFSSSMSESVQYAGLSVQISSVAQLCLTLQPHGLQHVRVPCPSLTSWTCSNSCPSSQWCHPTISSSVVPFSSHLESLPASRSLPMSQFFASGGQSIGAPALASVPPMNISGLTSFRIDWFDCCPRDPQEILQHLSSKASVLQCSAFFVIQLSYLYMTTEKTIALTRWTFVGNASAF